MNTKYIPAYDLDLCSGKNHNKTITVPHNQHVVSMYTGDIVGFGPIALGTKTDVEPGHPKYGEDFYVISHVSGMWLAHSELPDLV
ncbi:hypothetical protein QLL95_gp0193 [Cotonvirus japonicus]|uniref:Uncharacterized protein n=1 Tax=Cotonvirus japonicus TaxID=2811091 RepID=A0ABM7NR95_9VIRU|nr:hypothetical protein QLL95_gp0193 [Cotonvirus japonicus]BCS82682.1 hypothetical protein [Cotonvirus japonicus]